MSPGNALTFAGNILHGSGTNSVTLTGPGNVIFLGNATYQGATTINGGNLTVGATGSLPSTTTLNINNASTVELDNPAQTLAVLNGSSASTLNLFNESGTMLTVGAGSFAGSINDGGNAASLTKTTTGILYLTGANTYYGSTTVTAGALLYGSMSSVSTVAQNNSITVSTSGAVGLESGGLPSLLPYLTSASNGTLVVTPATSADAVNLAANSLSLGALDSETYTGVLTPSGTNYRLGGGGGSLTFAPSLTGSLGLIVNGPPTGGAVILTATNNSFTGGTLISAGTLQVGNGSLTGSLPGYVVNNGILVLDPSATQALTLPGVISGGGNLVMLGNGVATLTAPSTYTGRTLISSGTLQLGNGASLSSSSTITDNGTLAFHNSGTLTQGVNFSPLPIVGSGALLVSAGSVTLNVVNTYGGGTTVTGGTLVINPNALNGGTSLIGSGALTIGPGALVQAYVNSFGFTAAGNTTPGSLLSVNINGGVLNSLTSDSHLGALALTGGTLSGVQFDPHLGITTLASSAESLISAATLRLEANNTFNVSAGSVAGGIDLLVSSVISQDTNAYGLTKTGGGLMAIAGANTYSGGTTITAGTLQLAGSAATLGAATAP